MRSPHLIWLNGDFLPADAARLSIDDAAITSGVTVTERLRTFRHEPFLLQPHLDRLFESAKAAYIEPSLSNSKLGELVRDVIGRNAKLVPANDDLTVSIWISAGIAGRTTLCVSAIPIPAARYVAGLRLAVPPTRALDLETLSPAIKTRNRLHWHIADRQADAMEPGARALLLDREGFVTETAIANIFAVRSGRVRTPRRTRTLAGISQRYVFELAGRLDMDIAEADLTIEDLLAAEEVFCSGSVSCLQPVVRINQRAIGAGAPGLLYQRLLMSWSEAVGVEIAEQMRRMGRLRHE